jgi:hypothetical protein
MEGGSGPDGRLTGAMQDFAFRGPAQANYPIPPITGFEILTAPVFSFDLLSVMVTGQTANELNLNGTGVFHLPGFADTPGLFYLTANQAGNTFSLSASEAAVPEPSSLPSAPDSSAWRAWPTAGRRS